ncbi:MAG: NfeD family protein [Planctomycetota bacterium]
MDPLYISLLLLLAGLMVIFLELFVPSAGILGIVAGILLVSGVIVAFFDGLQTGAIVLILTVVSIPVLLVVMVQIWPHTPIGRRVLIGARTEEEVLPQTEAYTDRERLVGRIGIAKTKMLPSGIILIDDAKYDALSDGFAIEQNQPVKVVAIKGTRILVQPYDGEIEDVNDLPAADTDVLAQPIEDLGIGPIDDLLDN